MCVCRSTGGVWRTEESHRAGICNNSTKGLEAIHLHVYKFTSRTCGCECPSNQAWGNCVVSKITSVHVSPHREWLADSTSRDWIGNYFSTMELHGSPCLTYSNVIGTSVLTSGLCMGITFAWQTLQVSFLNQESLVDTIQQAVEAKLLESNNTRTFSTQVFHSPTFLGRGSMYNRSFGTLTFGICGMPSCHWAYNLIGKATWS